MVDLVEWLLAQLDEDGRIARAATPGPWTQSGIGEYGWGVSFSRPGAGVEAEDSEQGRADAEHIAAHDPARVLREIEAKRGVVARYEFARHEAAALDIGEEERKTRIASAAAFQSCVLLIAGTFEDRPGYAEAIASVE